MTRSRVLLIALSLLATFSCDHPSGPRPSTEPISVRGWIQDIAGSATTAYPETESARKRALFAQTYVEVEGAPYVSGGVQDDGSFVLLDVPPGSTTITFTAPGVVGGKLKLSEVPGRADVIIPALILASGAVKLGEPRGVVVRLPGDIYRKLEQTAVVAGQRVQVVQVPVKNMSDRRDFPSVPKGSHGNMPTLR